MITEWGLPISTWRSGAWLYNDWWNQKLLRGPGRDASPQLGVGDLPVFCASLMWPAGCWRKSFLQSQCDITWKWQHHLRMLLFWGKTLCLEGNFWLQTRASLHNFTDMITPLPHGIIMSHAHFALHPYPQKLSRLPPLVHWSDLVTLDPGESTVLHSHCSFPGTGQPLEWQSLFQSHNKTKG